MKKRGLFYFSKQITAKSDMTYDSLINGNFRIDMLQYNLVSINSPLVTDLLKKILESDGKVELSTLNPLGDYEHTYKISPDYKLAWNTLYKLKIIKEID